MKALTLASMRGRRPARWIGGGSAILAVLVVAAACTGSPAGSEPESAAPSESLPAPALPSPRPPATAYVATGAGPATLAASADWLWVELHRENRVGRIDPETNTQVENLAIGVHCGIASSGGDSVWATYHADNRVTRFDQDTGEVLDEWEMPACGLAADGENAWVTTPGEPDTAGSIHELVPGQPEPARSIEVGAMIFGLALTPADVWVTGEQDGGTVWRVDRATGAVTTIGQFTGVDQVLSYADAIWLTSRSAGHMWKLNPADGSVLAEASILSASGMAVHDGTIWITTFNDGQLFNVDPATAEIISSERLPYAYLFPPASAFGALWASALENNLVMRIEPGS